LQADNEQLKASLRDLKREHHRLETETAALKKKVAEQEEAVTAADEAKARLADAKSDLSRQAEETTRLYKQLAEQEPQVAAFRALADAVRAL
jgi:regulator of replication initiation timing